MTPLGSKEKPEIRDNGDSTYDVTYKPGIKIFSNKKMFIKLINKYYFV